jgi:hypothetical protein
MLSLAELQRRIDSGDLSPDAAISLSLDAVGTREKTIGAFVCRDENVRAQNAGPLRGIAVASRTSSTPQIFRPKWVRRSTGDSGRARTHLSWLR